jgi:hypothetical protein
MQMLAYFCGVVFQNFPVEFGQFAIRNETAEQYLARLHDGTDLGTDVCLNHADILN